MFLKVNLGVVRALKNVEKTFIWLLLVFNFRMFVEIIRWLKNCWNARDIAVWEMKKQLADVN